MMSRSARDPHGVHLGRLLLLVEAFSSGEEERLEGFSKLARLDFLIRYPVYLERVVTARNRTLPFELWPTSSERLAVESAVRRHRYGPFDTSYYEFVGRLLGMGLCEQTAGHPVVSLRATATGRAAAARLGGAEWSTVRGRAEFVRRALNLSGRKLGDLIDAQLPTSEVRPWAVLSAR